MNAPLVGSHTACAAAAAGVPYAVAGMLYVVTFSRWLLVGDDTKRHSDLLFVARVTPDSPAANNTVRGAGLKRLDRLFLVAVERQVRRRRAAARADRLRR